MNTFAFVLAFFQASVQPDSQIRRNELKARKQLWTLQGEQTQRGMHTTERKEFVYEKINTEINYSVFNSTLRQADVTPH